MVEKNKYSVLYKYLILFSLVKNQLLQGFKATSLAMLLMDVPSIMLHPVLRLKVETR